MTRQEKYRGFASVCAASLALLPAAVCEAGTAASAPAATPMRVAIRVEQVVTAIRSSGMPLDGATITLLASMTAASSAPILEVRAVEPWGPRRARVLLRCQEHASCTPFYVMAEWSTNEAAQIALHVSPLSVPAVNGRQAKRLAGGSLEAQKPDATAGNAASVPPLATQQDRPAISSRVLAANSPAPMLVHAGTRATLLLDGTRLHIQVPVICLENGTAGRTIRVTAADHKQTYLAEVVDGSILKGTL